ncbi:MAG TPA: DUF1559 domain-containing protein [Pirellulales bacterium]|nr:DUF1559 domain-containing protein [Pirellulales bacterium]
MMRYSVLCTLGLMLSGADAAQAQTQLVGDHRANAIAPFVDEQTIGLARVDLTRLDFDQLLKQAALLAPGSEKLLAPAVEYLRPMAEHLVDSGVKEVYLVASLADVPHPPFFVFPLAAGADASSLEQWHGELHVETIEHVGKALFAGDKKTLERIKRQSPAARPEIARAFAAAGDSAVQLLLLPTADNRRVIEELLPTLPAEVGGGSTKVVTRGAMWAAAGIDLTPQPRLRLVMQSQDREAAAALHDKWLAVLKLIGRDARVAKIVPQFEEIAVRLAPEIKGDRLQLTLEKDSLALGPLAELLQTAGVEAQKQAQRNRAIGHLKQIGLAFHNYHDVYKTFPAAASYSPDGKPLLSWRVHILPFLDQAPLYKEFHLDEPWDSEHNRKLIERMPETYRSRNWSPDEPTKTCLVGVTGDGGRIVVALGGSAGAPVKDRIGTMFQGREGIKIQQVTDGTSNTILVVESDAEHAVVWTKPDDLPYDAEQPVKGFGFDENGMVPTLFCDGSVRMLKKSLEAETWRRLLLRNDGNPVSSN